MGVTGLEPAALPARLPADAPLFTVPAGLVRILNRDLIAAGIPKRDERGRTVDVHAMRTTFGTLLSKGGVAPRTAQAAMRHSKIDLTMNVYTDPRLLDVQGAVEALPDLPLAGGRRTEGIVAKATGTDDSMAFEFAPEFAPTTSKPCKSGSIPAKTAPPKLAGSFAEALDASAYPVNEKDLLATPVSRSLVVGVTGLEPVTSSLSRKRTDRNLLGFPHL